MRYIGGITFPGAILSSIVSLFSRQKRSKDQFIAVLRPHVDLMYRMAWRWTNDQQQAEDLVQEVLIKLSSRVDEIAGLDQPRPWLIKVLYRQFVDQHRRQSRRLEVVETDLEAPAENSESEGQNSLLEVPATQDPSLQLADAQQLQLALAQLDPEQKDVVLLHDAEGYSDSETAEILGISKGTVKSRLHRARKKLKKILSPGTIPESGACQGVKER